MPLRSPKMYSFIFGFQRFVWWPKCTPASNMSFNAIELKLPPSRSTPGCRAARGQPRIAPEKVYRDTSLPLAELEALAGAGHAVLLALLDPWIAREKTGL